MSSNSKAFVIAGAYTIRATAHVSTNTIASGRRSISSAVLRNGYAAARIERSCIRAMADIATIFCVTTVRQLRTTSDDPSLGTDLDLVVLGGAGHVGLPLALAFADSGIRVGIFDLAVDKLDRLSKGELPFRESGAAELLERGR